MNTKRNPFSAGRWVTGPSFFGRKEFIESLLNSNESCDWVIGKRRVGKTSLLRQLEMLVNQRRADRFALFWDIEGSYDANGLRDSLIDAIEDSQDEYEEKWENSEFELDEGKPCANILKSLLRAFSRKNCRLVLLIDEAEEFITIGKQDPTSLGKLRKIFHNPQGMHTIISSTPRLEQIHKTIESETSPFLHGFHASYLGNLERNACDALLTSGIEAAGLREQIMEKTDRNPFETQLLAKHFFENRDLDEVVLHLEANPSLSQVIEVNFDLLTPEEQDLLKDIFCGKTHVMDFTGPTEQVIISKLLQMGYLEKADPDKLRIGSYFQNQWLKTKLSSSPSFHAQHQSDPYLSKDLCGLLPQNTLNIYKFFLEIADEGKKLKSFDQGFKVSTIDKNVYPDRTKIELIALEVSLPAWQTAVSETVSLMKYFLDEITQWSLFRLIQMADEGPNRHTEADFLDLMMLITEEAQL